MRSVRDAGASDRMDKLKYKNMTKKSLLLIAGICLALFAVAQKKSKDGAKVNWKKVNVLVYIKNGKGYVHETRAAGVAAIKQLGAQYGFSVTSFQNTVAIYMRDLRLCSNMLLLISLKPEWKKQQ